MFSKLFDTSDFPARWYCGTWSDLHGWVHICADFAIFAAYMAIPCVICYFALQRKGLPFLKVYWLFAGFILFCGFGHLVEATIFWHPWYRFSALVKVCTALVSWGTVFVLIPTLPHALALPGRAALSDELKESNDELNTFARHLTGREDRVIELKEEVNRLLVELGRDSKYLQSLATPDGGASSE